MSKVELHCLMVGHAFEDYPGLASSLRKLDIHTDFKQISNNRAVLKHALKRLHGASLVFVPEELFTKSSVLESSSSHPKDALHEFADLIWQYASDAIVVVLHKKQQSSSFAYYVNDIQMSRMHFSRESKNSQLKLQFLVQTALLKFDFRRCKRLLGVSEKRCQWLVDSSTVPVAYISRDLHLYANTPYLSLLGIDSIKSLRSLSIKDFISKDEHKTFDGFIRDQLKRPQESQSLFLQMQKKDGSKLRTNIRVIPAVFKSRRCLQLWVNSLESQRSPTSEVEKLWDQNKETLNVKSNKAKESNLKKGEKVPYSQSSNTINPSLILKEIINRKEAQIVTHSLLDLNKIASQSNVNKRHYMVSLKVPFTQRHAVDDLLTKVSHEEIKTLRSLFWDKVKLTRLFQILSAKKAQNVRLLVRLSEATITNKNQLIWLHKCFNKLQSRSSMIVFMLPSRLDEKTQKAAVEFIQKFKPYGCQFGLDDFFVNSQSLALLKHCKPQVLRLYLPWLQGIEGNEQREFALGRFIRQIESRNIKIIVPCGFSQDMKKLFILSGASFCQEKMSKGD